MPQTRMDPGRRAKLSALVRDLQAELGSIAELARTIEHSPANISNIATGTRPVSIEAIASWAPLLWKKKGIRMEIQISHLGIFYYSITRTTSPFTGTTP